MVESFTGLEAVNEAFYFDIQTLSVSTSIDLKQFIGEEITLRLLQADGSYRAWHGYCTEASWLGADGGMVRYHLRLESFLAFLNLRRDAFIFQDKNVQQIITDLLAEYPQANFSWEATQALTTYPIYTQYRESDLAFFTRILAAEGLSWRFEHVQDNAAGQTSVANDNNDNSKQAHAKHTLVIFDSQTPKPDTLVDAYSGSTIRFHGVRATEETDSIHQFNAQRQVQSNAVSLASWHPVELQAFSAELTSELELGDLPDLPVYKVAAERWFNDGAQADLHSELHLHALSLHNKQFSGAGGARALLAGHAFNLSQHDQYAEGNNRFTVISVQHAATNNFVHGVVDTFAHTLMATAASLLAVTDGATGYSLENKAAPKPSFNIAQLERGIYRNRFSCVRDGVPIVPTPTALRHHSIAMGAQIALVVGLSNARLTTERDHRIEVQFPWQRGVAPIAGGLSETGNLTDSTGNAPLNETSGTWVRVAETLAGPNWGSHFTPRIGTEVLVDFIEGDMDKPVVIGALYNGADLPPYAAGVDSGVNHAGVISGVHSQALSGDGYNQWVVDDTGAQLRIRLASSQAASQLNMGYLIHQSPYSAQRGHYRGLGVELRTDAWGVMRGQEGVLLSTTTLAGVGASVHSTQMDVAESVAQLHGAKSLSDAMSQSAQNQTALMSQAANSAHTNYITQLDVKQLGKYTSTLNGQTALKAKAGSREFDSSQPVERFNTPVLHMDSPSTIHLASPASTVMFAGQHLHWTTQADTHWTAGHTLASVSGNATSLYTLSGGIQAFAANGAVSIQAHTDDLELLADEEVVVTSSQAHIHINAAKKITLKAGQSSITLDGANITFACPGKFKVKAGKHAFRGTGSKAASFAPLPNSKVSFYNQKVKLIDTSTGLPLEEMPYFIRLKNGNFYHGVTNKDGLSELAHSDETLQAKTYIGHTAMVEIAKLKGSA